MGILENFSYLFSCFSQEVLYGLLHKLTEHVFDEGEQKTTDRCINYLVHVFKKRDVDISR